MPVILYEDGSSEEVYSDHPPCYQYFINLRLMRENKLIREVR
jgi:hypothetical protein